jgi:carbamoyltransferase
VGYNGFPRSAEVFGRLYHQGDVDRHLLIGHDAAAAILVDGELVAAVEEERLNREKKTSAFPVNALRWCLEYAGVSYADVDVFAFPWRFSTELMNQTIAEISAAATCAPSPG